MLKKSASGVLASLRGSTYRSVRLASSLAAALLDSLFEHPAGRPLVVLVNWPLNFYRSTTVYAHYPSNLTFPAVMTATILTVMLLSYGCASSSPKVVSTLTVPSLPAPKTLGSLWQEENGRAYLYEDMRAMRVGDILTIKIIENHKGSKSADTSAERDSTINNSLNGNAIGYIGIPGIRLGAEARRGLGIDASASNKFEGKGTTNREGTLTGTISSVVTEVLPNGDLRIEGRREVTVNSEKQLMTIAGIVRRVDVNTKNTVLSSAIADAKIEYSGLGVLGDVQRPGWLVRILNWISPI
jgi:flagellar L-ring protein precursor FlgH